MDWHSIPSGRVRINVGVYLNYSREGQPGERGLNRRVISELDENRKLRRCPRRGRRNSSDVHELRVIVEANAEARDEKRHVRPTRRRVVQVVAAILIHHDGLA